MEPTTDLANGQSAAMDWEQGCAQDEVRRDFVVPTVGRLLTDRKPRRVLDVGAGTGFVSRTIDDLMSYRVQWTLVDYDKERLRIAAQLAPSAMDLSLICGDLSGVEWNGNGGYYDAVLICFTIVEFAEYRSLLTGIVDVLAEKGFLVIIIPDPWEEVCDQPSLAKELLTARVAVDKTDKFTHKPYPYYISRTEDIIRSVLSYGFVLDSIQASSSDKLVYVMTFSNRLQLSL